MNDLININKSNSQVQIKIKDMIGKYNRLPYNYQSKIGYDSLAQKLILEEITN